MSKLTDKHDIQIVRYGELKPCFDAFIDTRTPGSDQKENFTIIGPGVSENPNQHVHIMEPHGFNIGAARQPPQCVNSQHSHDTSEFFYVHTGTWSFDLGENGDDASIILNPGDAISIPTAVFRGFKNIGDDTGFLWAVLGGDDPGSVLWAPHVFDMAKDYGLCLLENGRLVDINKGETIPDTVKIMPKTTPEQVSELQKFSTQQLRDCCVISSDDIPHDKGQNYLRRKIISPDGQLQWPHEFTVEEIRIAAHSDLALGSGNKNQVMFAHSGNISITTPSDKKRLETGDTATIACGVERTISNEADDEAIIIIVNAFA